MGLKRGPREAPLSIAGGGLIAVYQRAEYIEERTEMAHTLWQALNS